ncbi:hypothetical protein [Halobacillus andaensis]|uniref:hypothetical protein n=1 Tax=Halobacillus andaensis TaxID=1176239 RepID=UPI003D721669
MNKNHFNKQSLLNTLLNPNPKTRKKRNNFVQFAYDNQDYSLQVPIPFEDEGVIATVLLDRLKAGNVVSLNGLLFVNNNSEEPGTVVARILRVTGDQEEIIYSIAVEIESEGGDDFGQPIPLLYVDEMETDEETVAYGITVEKLDEDSELFVVGPATLTATEIARC